MPEKPKQVDQYIQRGCGRCALGGTPACKVRPWQEELRMLRTIILKSSLSEEIKWSAPCYTHKGKNVLMLAALKECVTVSFFRGDQLNDPDHILEKPGDYSRFARVIRFGDVSTIARLEATLLRTIQEAIVLEESGQDVKSTDAGELAYPEELMHAFAASADFETAFAALTPGRQRGYLIHFTSAKQSKTRIARIEQCQPKILLGKGWHER